MLTSQFIMGLRADLKAKVAGKKGDFEELLVKARFEEARLRDFHQPLKARVTPTTKVVPPQTTSDPRDSYSAGRRVWVYQSLHRRSVDEELQLSHVERPCLGDSQVMLLLLSLRE